MGHKGRGVTSLYTHLFADAFDGVEEALAAVFGVNQTSTARSVPSGPELDPDTPHVARFPRGSAGSGAPGQALSGHGGTDAQM
jgi:hypothetical protein